MSNYRRGADFERRRVEQHYERGAVFAARTAGSHGKVDVIGVYADRIELEQLKVTRSRGQGSFGKELAELGLLQRKFGKGARVKLVVKRIVNGNGSVYEIIPSTICLGQPRA